MRVTQQRGPIFLEFVHCGNGTTWYLLRSCSGTRTRVLLEIEVYADGKVIDLQKLAKFWGNVPRPL